MSYRSPQVILAVVAAFSCLVDRTSGSAAEPLQYPLSVAAAEGGTIYIADRNWPGIWKMTDGVVEPYFQGSKKFRTPLNAVRCVKVDGAGRVYAGDSSTREVYRFNEQGEPVPLTNGYIGIPMDIAIRESEELLVADLETHRIYRVPLEGGEPQEFAVLPAPRGLHLLESGELLVVSHGPNHILKVSADGKTIEPFVAGQPFEFAHTITADGEGNLYVCDGYAKAIWKITADGTPEKWVTGAPLDNPVGITWFEDRLLIADPRAATIFAASPDGTLTSLVKSNDASK